MTHERIAIEVLSKQYNGDAKRAIKAKTQDQHGEGSRTRGYLRTTSRPSATGPGQQGQQAQSKGHSEDTRVQVHRESHRDLNFASQPIAIPEYTAFGLQKKAAAANRGGSSGGGGSSSSSSSSSSGASRISARAVGGLVVPCMRQGLPAEVNDIHTSPSHDSVLAMDINHRPRR